MKVKVAFKRKKKKSKCGENAARSHVQFRKKPNNSICCLLSLRKKKKAEITPEIRKKLKRFEYGYSKDSFERPTKGRQDGVMTKSDKEEIESKF